LGAGIKSGPGESCLKSSDCKPALRCFANVCADKARVRSQSAPAPTNSSSATAPDPSSPPAETCPINWSECDDIVSDYNWIVIESEDRSQQSEGSRQGIQRLVYDKRKAGDNLAAICIGSEALDEFALSGTLAGRVHYDMALAYKAMRCDATACENIGKSLEVRPQRGNGFRVACEKCQEWRCAICPGCSR
jgi:hypothetical protein